MSSWSNLTSLVETTFFGIDQCALCENHSKKSTFRNLFRKKSASSQTLEMSREPIITYREKLDQMVGAIKNSYLKEIVKEENIEEGVYEIGHTREMCSLLGVDYVFPPRSLIAAAIRQYFEQNQIDNYEI